MSDTEGKGTGSCENDSRGVEEIRVCLPEVPDKVFYFYRYDYAFGNRRKDVATTPNGWAKLPTRLNITLENIARASYAWYTTFEYKDYDKVNLREMAKLSEHGGPLFGAFNIPIGYSPKGEAISEIGDPLAMVGDDKVQDLDNRGPCIVGTSWNWRVDADDKTEAFIAAVGLHTHPSFHERCNNNAHCIRDRHDFMSFGADANMRYTLPWTKEECGAGGKHMKDNKHHWCDGTDDRVVKMRPFLECTRAPADYKRQYNQIPE